MKKNLNYQKSIRRKDRQMREASIFLTLDAGKTTEFEKTHTIHIRFIKHSCITTFYYIEISRT